jgi:hypothetical protein
MSDIKIEITNLTEVERELERGYLKSLEAGQRLIKRYTNNVKRDAKINLRNKVKNPTGRLNNSIKTRFEDDGLTGICYTSVHYAPHVEWGHRLRDNSYWRGYHYMLDAFNQHESNFLRDVKRIIEF